MKSRKKKQNHISKKRAAIGWVLGVPLIVAVLIVVILHNEKEGDGISRALAAKSVVLAFHSPEELEEWQKSYGASHFPAKALE